MSRRRVSPCSGFNTLKIRSNVIKQSIRTLLNRLWHHISPRRRRQLGLLLVLVLLTSLAEILSIGAVLPFLGILTAPERIFTYTAAQPLIQAVGLTEPEQLLIPLTITFCAAALIAGAMRVFLLWASTRLSFAAGADLSISIYRRALYQPYAVHCARNSSEVIDGISGKANGVIYSIILPTLMLLNSSIMLISILIVLMAVEPVVALSAFGGFGLIYMLINRLTRKQLLCDSKRIARESTQVIKSLQEGLGGIRDVLIDGSQSTYCKIYRDSDLPLRRAQGNIIVISQGPRSAMEALGMILIAIMAYTLTQHSDGTSKAIPILGALALGAQRLLPLLQQAYVNWTHIKGGQASLQDTLELLDQPLPEYADQSTAHALPFKDSINLKQLGFRYSLESSYILEQLDLSVAKGSRVGIIGTTGSGKSTLLDIVMGLLQPTDGKLEVDGQAVTLANNRAWQAHIAQVPQVIFLADSTIEENIAFGVPKDQIDHHRVREAAQQAQISISIEAWPKHYQTFVGERGILLSGGQRQRIGIARALYKQADVLIFDEATSSLDNDTERSVMDVIESLSSELTVLIVAHRLTTLKRCTQVIELAHGKIIRNGTYSEIVKNVYD
jgi:ATP-binding cassette, subfamily B, bacterial PglK